MAVVAARLLLAARRVAGRDLLAGAEAAVEASARAQGRGLLLVDLQPLGLQVGTAGAADAGALVPVEAQPLHAAQDRLVGGVGAALLVGVLDAQDEGAARLAGVEPVEQGRARAAHVQVARGAGREAQADGGLVIVAGASRARRRRDVGRWGERGCTASPMGSGPAVASTAAASRPRSRP